MKTTKYTKAPVAFFRVLRVFRGCMLALPIGRLPFFDAVDRRFGGGGVARPHGCEAAQ